MRVRVTADVKREKQTELDGAWHGWADPGGEMGGDGCYPFVFDSPDFHLTRLHVPEIVDVQIAAFAHQLNLFETEAAYDAAGDVGKPKFAVESFIPAGLFRPGGEKTEGPEAQAILAGRILETERRINPLSGQPFQWALVKTLGGLVDVVADPELVTKPMTKGGVLSGTFWLSGRIVSKAGSGFFRRLFGK
jgi:hypothetical protein